MVKGDLASRLAASSLDVVLPTRPGYGTAGKRIVLHTNYLALKTIDTDLILYRYTVILPKVKSKKKDGKLEDLPAAKKRRLIENLLQMAPFKGLTIASDWAQILVSTKKIPLEIHVEDKQNEFFVEWYPADGTPLPAQSDEEPDNVRRARERNTFRIPVHFSGTVSTRDLQNDLAQPSSNYPLKLETIQALNIVIASGPSTDPDIATVSRNKFYPFGKHPQLQSADLGFGLEALRGYYSSVRTGVNRILVNLNVATGAFYKPGPLIDMMMEVSRGQLPQNPQQHRILTAFFRLVKIETNYLPAKDKDGKVTKKGATKRKVHIITKLSELGQNSQTVSFSVTDDKGKATRTTIQQHYKKHYNIDLRYPQAPLVNYGTIGDPKWLPAELCKIAPGQVAKRLLLGPQTSEMIKFAARKPHQNAESIVNDGLRVAKIQPVNDGFNVHLKPFGIKVATNLLTVPGRILVQPVLQYRAKLCTPSNGSWNLDTRALGNNPFRVSKPLGSWHTVVIQDGGRVDVAMLERSVQLFARTLDTYGLQPGPVQQPVFVNISSVDIANKNVGNVQAAIGAGLKNGLKAKPNFLFFLLPSDNAVVYDSIKYVCDVSLGVPNICNIARKFTNEKGQMQYFANVAMKFNQKLGGVNHTVALDKLKPLDAQTILFGIDVTHPSPGSSESAPSIAGVVASVDSLFSQFPASMRTQKGRQEMVTELEDMIVERLTLWRKRNQNRLPNKVILYRDGVSEGQYHQVLALEYPAFVKAFNRLYGVESKHPKMSIIVVGKRHHTRFYPSSKDDMDERTGNPKCGTVVDRGITGEKIFDFFLQAHHGLQGTAKPAHYVVIKDENKFGADQIQSLTHHLCYTFARATRSVSICPPAYYADLLCERGRSYLQSVLKGDADEFSDAAWHRDVNPALMETMYYL
ncbi:Piwi-domain-containing protein [Pyrenochaeta sp. DS3sAY3a]|nr:Piwi-domain-containing protein [Pyrenochaeta sp. DS3sAY3a]